MSIEENIEMIPVLLGELRDLRRELAELRRQMAGRDEKWVSPSEKARADGCSVDTVFRKIDRGELEVKELGRSPLRGKNGKQLLDRDGRPRFRRTLRVRLSQPITEAEVNAIASDLSR